MGSSAIHRKREDVDIKLEWLIGLPFIEVESESSVMRAEINTVECTETTGVLRPFGIFRSSHEIFI
jgi:hypothetical protein